jgi:putative ABC transport system substrate-binding protein
MLGNDCHTRLRLKRRVFCTIWVGATSSGSPSAGMAQSAPLVGFMSGRSPADSAYTVAAFRQGLAQARFAEGQNVNFEFRWANGGYRRLPKLASELLSKNVAVLVSVGGDASPIAAKQLTSTTPIVFGMGGDPVKFDQ